jgi:hypothetical protein
MKAWLLTIAVAAVLQTSPAGRGTLSGTVVQFGTAIPIEDVEVHVEAVASTSALAERNDPCRVRTG